MKLTIEAAHELISNMRAAFQVNPPKHSLKPEAPLRAELFSSEQMTRYARTLAKSHDLSSKSVPGHLIVRLTDNERVLNAARKLLVEVLKDGRLITPAGEWLIDNFYLIEEQIHTAKKHLPKGYSASLPQLLTAATPSRARVYDIALQIISHSDGKIDEERLSEFIRSYQSGNPLTLGELWAIPIMLRITLIENLRRVSALIAIDRVDVNLADYWSKQITETALADPKNLIPLIGDMARSQPPMVSAFISEMNRELQGKGAAVSAALAWIEQHLNEDGRTTQELVHTEVQKQAMDQVSVSNSIGSLRLLATIDWRDFVESHSAVERILREDFTGVYGFMDFTTRDNYRHVVENIAKQTRRSESDIATLAINLAANNKSAPGDRHKAHVGYFLIGKGLRQTRKEAGLRASLLGATIAMFSRNRLVIYLAAIFVITVAVSLLLLWKAYDDDIALWLLCVIAVLLVLSASQLAISVVNFFATLLVKPHLLPRMDYSGRIPDQSSTLVVIPAMLSDKSAIEDLVESLEVRFLANRNTNLRFGLITDFTDASEESLPTDAVLLALAQDGINALKKKYEKDKQEIFYFFHRPRLWNKKDKTWMGYERKRGKLADLNGLLRGNLLSKFLSIIGDVKTLQQIKYVITLDADTRLPRGSAWKMIATMAHPLNHAQYDERKKRVTEGYGILQPRVTVSLPGPRSSFYSRLHGNEPGIDPYTRATSDVYQDLCGEGSFIGKGIYDVDVVELALKGKFQENRILSHDLLEGCYVRSGLLSDVELFESYPSSYRADMKRRARWIRGDWQIFPWFLPFVPGVDKRLHANPLSALSRWKVFDNIRRSLIPIALTTLIIMGWTMLGAPLFWTMAISAIIVFPIFVSVAWDAFRKSEEVIFAQHIKLLIRNTHNVVVQTFFTVICLPYEAYVSLRAIALTMWRTLLTHRNLLQWHPSANYEKQRQNTLAASYASMWISPLLTFGILFCQCINAPLGMLSAAPIVILWAFAPFITWVSSKRLMAQKFALTVEQTVFLRVLARKTWAFFERFVTEQENWLPPDNFQQYPAPVVAHRTSPTNIGLSLLANLSAHDFGYLSAKKLLERLGNTIGTLKKLERYRGHFYNWYDTETLTPLLPKYISTVDSGNLAGHLLTLRQGIFELAYSPISCPALFPGLRDTLTVFSETIDDNNRANLSSFSAILMDVGDAGPSSVQETAAVLQRLSESFAEATGKMALKKDSISDWWKGNISKLLLQALENYWVFTPWLSLPPSESPHLAGIFLLENGFGLDALNKRIEYLQAEMPAWLALEQTQEEHQWLQEFSTALTPAGKEVQERIENIEQLGHDCIGLADMDLEFLYDTSKHLLTIGYNVSEQACDPGYYDLLASEARLCVFVAIAQGKLPEESWFALGRQLTNVEGASILLSWSGSMFEYLMPLLVMPTYENTLLDQTYKSSVQRQIAFGRQRGIPWGVSESGYNMVDANSNYQYRAFGVLGLGLKRGLELDSVVAPYATMLALMVEPDASCKNLERLVGDGFDGDYGFFESIDYTTSRVQRGQTAAIVQSFMAHHEGMSLLSVGYLLLGQPMQRRFEAEPQFKATLLLLQERIPKASSFYAHTTHLADYNIVPSGSQVRIVTSPDTPIPEVQLLSNGNYHIMLTAAGGGYSRWKDLAVTRWREDSTCDNWGIFCYIRDLESGKYWSNTYQPTSTDGKTFEAAFSQGRVDFHLTLEGIETHTEIVVSPEDDIEMRRLKLSNKSDVCRTIEITSYVEVVLATPASDNSQQAFSNLFVQTEILAAQQAIICSRRPRSAGEQPPWMFHSMAINGAGVEETSYETDRMAFLGHGNTPANPQALERSGALGNNQGSVLDPIVSIRHKLILEAGASTTIDLILGIGDTRQACENLIEKYSDRHHKDRVFELAWTHSQVVLRQINASEAEEQLFGKLAGSIIYANPALRAEAAVIIKNQRGQSGLWGYSISGDLPILLLQIDSGENMELAQQLIKAHTYWRLKGLLVDLVIWNEEHNGYRQTLQTEILALIPGDLVDKPGGVFVRVADQISIEDRILFQTVARVVIMGDKDDLEQYLKEGGAGKSKIPYLKAGSVDGPENDPVKTPDDLLFFNGSGGFSQDGSEYVIALYRKNRTPVPWVNVIANPVFGTVVSESGQAYTWVENAHEMRLTPWSNDPVSDTGGEQFYLRDEKAGNYWSATPLPRCGDSAYVSKHGFGYSSFEHSETGIHSEMLVFVDIELPVKFTILRLRNDSDGPRNLSVTGYAEWVLGDIRAKTAMHIVTQIDPNTGALFSRNPYSTEFANRVAFFDTDEQARTVTCDRTEFIGRNNSLQNPDAMQRIKLSGKVGVALDPCAAIHVSLFLAAGEEREIIFRLGAATDASGASELVTNTRGPKAAHEALEKVKAYWKHTTGAIKIETPDAALNIITNGWLTYQTMSCRLWGRSGYYQSGGAFGFRDQLQDVLSLLHAQPALARKQILLSASRQFEEGDVQHWWHPPAGRGVRTRISDDYLWLPFVTSRYVVHTGDGRILEESITFLKGRALNAGEESYFELPAESDLSASLYEHCVRAIKHGLNFGAHGLPLMGTGDWNDGMDRVGAEGKGESIWLGFFLYDVLIKFISVADLQQDTDFAAQCRVEGDKLKAALDKNGWDGDWYRRAYFDDGTPLGSNTNTDCQIDSIAQSWSVLSGAGAVKRTETAMAAANKRLVKREAGIIQLLDPPFDKGKEDPGYIKGYVPGVRENGGQYTHAAVWMVMAFAALGDHRRVWELLQLINPVNHGNSAKSIAVYKVEPYVVAGDVYALAPHTGRGGWTWYTGSASWMYQLIITSFLGVRVEGNKLTFKPCLPEEWSEVKVRYRYLETIYNIIIQQKGGAEKLTIAVDGILQKDAILSLVNDKEPHTVNVMQFASSQKALTTESLV